MAHGTVGRPEPRARRLSRVSWDSWRNSSLLITCKYTRTKIQTQRENWNPGEKHLQGDRLLFCQQLLNSAPPALSLSLKYLLMVLGSKQPALEITKCASPSSFSSRSHYVLDPEGAAKVRTKWTPCPFGPECPFSLHGPWSSCRDIARGGTEPVSPPHSERQPQSPAQ